MQKKKDEGEFSRHFAKAFHSLPNNMLRRTVKTSYPFSILNWNSRKSIVRLPVKSFSTTEASTTPLAKQIFPWKPLTTSPIESWNSRFERWFYWKFIINTITFPQFLEGAKQSFLVTSQALIDNTNLLLEQNRTKSLESTTISQEEVKNNENNIQSIDELLEARIAIFYQKSINELIQKYPNSKLYYSFKQSKKDLESFSIEMQTYRASFIEEILLKKFHPSFYNTGKQKSTLAPLELTEEEKKELGQVYDYENFVVRLYVTLQGEEVFYVKDEKTNEILQGSEKPQTVFHQVGLFNSILIDHEFEIRLGESWRLIDFDGWMQNTDEALGMHPDEYTSKEDEEEQEEEEEEEEKKQDVEQKV